MAKLGFFLSFAAVSHTYFHADFDYRFGGRTFACPPDYLSVIYTIYAPRFDYTPCVYWFFSAADKKKVLRWTRMPRFSARWGSAS